MVETELGWATQPSGNMARTAKWDQQFSTATVLVFTEANELRSFKIASPIKPRQICVRVCRMLQETSHFHRFSRPSSAPLPGIQAPFSMPPGVGFQHRFGKVFGAAFTGADVGYPLLPWQIVSLLTAAQSPTKPMLILNMIIDYRVRCGFYWPRFTSSQLVSWPP